MDIIKSQLPYHILDLIFSKFPIPTLANCRLVCKAWNNLILSRKIVPNSSISFAHISSQQKLYCIDFDSKSLKEGKSCIVASFTFHPRFSTFKIVNSCNGLFCLVDTQSIFGREEMRQPSVIILNPMTNECMELPPLDYALEFYSCYLGYGFGFSPNTKHYKIVRLAKVIHNGLFVADIFTVGTSSSCGKWNSIPFTPSYITSSGSDDGVYLNGCLYWVGYDHFHETGDRNKNTVLLRFDVEHEKFQEVSFPKREQDGTFIPYSYIRVFNSTLYLSGFDAINGWFNVWKMKQDSWIKEFVIRLPFISMVRHHINYFYKSKCQLQLIKTFEDGKILCLVSEKNLIFYDPKTKETEALDDKLLDGILWIYEIDSFNFGSLRNILGLNA